ncbi:hypothetical protein Droror1_Dr00021578 [Drosera rotundifolia]
MRLRKHFLFRNPSVKTCYTKCNVRACCLPSTDETSSWFACLLQKSLLIEPSYFFSCSCLRPCGFNADNFSDKCEQKVFNYAGVTCFNEEDFKDVKNMKGGYLAWVENGLPVTKPPEAEL